MGGLFAPQAVTTTCYAHREVMQHANIKCTLNNISKTSNNKSIYYVYLKYTRITISLQKILNIYLKTISIQHSHQPEEEKKEKTKEYKTNFS